MVAAAALSLGLPCAAAVACWGCSESGDCDGDADRATAGAPAGGGSSGAQVGAGGSLRRRVTVRPGPQVAAVRRQRWEQSIQAAQQRELDYIVEARDFFGSAEQAAPSADDAPAAGQLDGALERRVKTFGVPSPRAPLSIAVADRSPRSAATTGAGPAREWCSAALQRFVFGCAMHGRLGRGSPAHALPPELVREICELVLGKEVLLVCGGVGCREKGRSTEPATGPSPAECEPRIAVQQGDDSGAVHSWDTATEGSGQAADASASQPQGGSGAGELEALCSAEVLALGSGGVGGQWEAIAPMVQRRSAPAVCVTASGEVMAAGGYCVRSNRVLTSVELFNPAVGRWYESETPLPAPRAGALALAGADGSVLICGGVGEAVQECLSSTVVLPPNGEKWLERAPMRTARADHAGVVLPDGRALVVGGFGGVLDPVSGFASARYGGASRSVEMYCPVRDEWTLLPEMLEARQGAGAALLPLPFALPMQGEAWGEAGPSAARSAPPMAGHLSWVVVAGGHGLGPVIGGGRGGCLRTVEGVSTVALAAAGEQHRQTTTAAAALASEPQLALAPETSDGAGEAAADDEEPEDEEEAEADQAVQQLLVRAGVLPFVSLAWRPLPNLLRARRDSRLCYAPRHHRLIIAGGQDGGGGLLRSVESLCPATVHGWRAGWSPFGSDIGTPRREFGMVVVEL